MKITFNNVVLAQEFSDGGTDSVQDFDLPDGVQNAQWMPALRRKDQIPKARGNRTRIITGSIIPAPAPDVGTAMLIKALLFDTLPCEGPLIVLSLGQEITYPVAVLKTIRKLKDVTTGVSYGYELTFWAGKPNETTTPITNEAGVTIETESGETLTN